MRSVKNRTLGMTLAAIAMIATSCSSSKESVTPSQQGEGLSEQQGATPGVAEPLAMKPLAKPGERAEASKRAERREMDMEVFEELSPGELAQWWAYTRAKTADEYDLYLPLFAPVKLKMEVMGQGPLSVKQAVYSGVGSLLYYLPNAFEAVYKSEARPSECVPSWSDDPKQWDYFKAQCHRRIYDRLVQIKYDRPLYQSVGQVDPETLALILADLNALSQQGELLGAPSSHAYAAVAPAVHDYLLVWRAMEKEGLEKLQARFDKALDRYGMTYDEHDGRRGSITNVYEKVGRELGINGLYNYDYTRTIVGFWLRRSNDHTAEMLAETMSEVHGRLGGSMVRLGEVGEGDEEYFEGKADEGGPIICH